MLTTKRRRKNTPSRLAEDLIETAGGMQRAGLLDRATYEKITRRHLGPNKSAATARPSGCAGRQRAPSRN